MCCIIGGLGGVPLGGIEGISISSGGAPPNVPIATKIEIFQSPAPPPPPPPVPPEAQFGNFNVSGSLGGLVGEIVGQFMNPFPGPVVPGRGQPGGATEVPPPIRLQPSGETVPTLDFGFRPQPSGEVIGEVQTLNTGREFRPRREVETFQQAFQQGRELETGVRFGGDYEMAQRSVRAGTIPQLTGADPPQLPTLGCTSCTMSDEERQALLDRLPADYVEVGFRCPSSEEAEKIARGEPHACIAI